jgi:protein-L-isoaspartate(D-aspartate) O-methyltransferase
MAIMLEQLRLAAGQRVLEVGAGTGYNAAVMAQLVGDSGSVVSIDVEPDLVVRARVNLAAAECTTDGGRPTDALGPGLQGGGQLPP